MKKQTVFLITCAILVVAFVGGAWMFRQQRAADLGFLVADQAVTFVRPNAPRTGPADAKVYLVEFTDPACGTCAAFSPIIQQLMDAHPGKVQLVLRYAPFHEGSADVVRILEAARKQDKLWQTLHALYGTQGHWTQNHRVVLERVWEVLAHPQVGLGLDLERLRRDMDDPAIDKTLAQDRADAETLFVRKTPGIFVNGRPLEPFGVDQLTALVADEVRAKYPE